jgi:transcription initiation factor TFIIE subunit alpha|tara:strand:+ start:376 stop:924 length:549 start_codon:yes stop_codon:yes gene_type:complete
MQSKNEKMKQVYMLKKKVFGKKLLKEVVNELVGEEGLPIVFYLKGKKRISEFIIAEELDLEIHRTRNLLYKLYEHNIVKFLRKKDKIKGWYICYWDLNDKIIPELATKISLEKIEKLKGRLEREKNNLFYMCKNACARMPFENSIEFNFKCPECGILMHEQDNKRTIEFLTERLNDLENSKK